jgi:hypothetical protein
LKDTTLKANLRAKGHEAWRASRLIRQRGPGVTTRV